METHRVIFGLMVIAVVCILVFGNVEAQAYKFGIYAVIGILVIGGFVSRDILNAGVDIVKSKLGVGGEKPSS